jgi:hypothetical protein
MSSSKKNAKDYNVYNFLILAVLLYGCETWSLAQEKLEIDG